MLSRIMWISVAGIALLGGIAIQDGDWLFDWDDSSNVSARVERSIDDRVDRSVDHSFDKIQVAGPDGHKVDLPAETKRAMANAVGRLIKAEADLAIASVNDENDAQVQAARARRDQARAEVERLGAEIEAFERAANGENDTLREQIRREVREDIRASVRDAAGS